MSKVEGGSRRRTIHLAQFEGGAPHRRRYGRWRAGTLVAVHVLAAIHITHWAVAGKTLAPLELNEAMNTLEWGILTAGFVLMVLIALSSAVFGRFFCSWGCHILALQDLASWVLRTLRIRAKPVRSRVLLLVAPCAMVYMFIWPQVRNLVWGPGLPTVHFAGSTSDWSSFVTDDFWRNLPGPGVALLTFAVCGFAIVYILGTRSFCQYACPYGVLFGLADRVAPGRIKVDPAKCTACGLCTAVCDSHVRVHEEIARYGSVVDANCLKDLDCVQVCPERALSFGWTRPSLFRSLRPARRSIPYDFTLREDCVMAGVFLCGFFAMRGLYGVVPFLLSLALGAILAYGAVLCMRIITREHVRFNRFQLKIKGKVTRAGRRFLAGAALVGLFVLHSGVIRYHEVAGRRALNGAVALVQHGGEAAEVRDAARSAAGHLGLCERYGMLTAPNHHVLAASAAWAVGDVEAAEASWAKAIEQSPDNAKARLDLAASLLLRGRFDAAVGHLRAVTDMHARYEKDIQLYIQFRMTAWRMIGAAAARRGDLEQARTAYEAAARETARRGPAR